MPLLSLANIGRTVCGAAMAWLFALGSAQADGPPAVEPGPSQVYRLEQVRDYVRMPRVPLQVRANGTSRINFGNTNCSPCWGEVISYTTFSQPTQTFNVARYDGAAITLLIPTVHPRAAKLNPVRIQTLVDRLDLLYASYKELLGWAPELTSDPRGKQVFAFLPNEPTNFYGLAFAPGDSTEYSNAVLDEIGLDDDILTNVFVHELAHNFDVMSAWAYGPDSSHNWTTILQEWFARVQAKMADGGSSVKRPTAVLNDWLGTYWKPYLANPALTWADCAAAANDVPACTAAQAQYLMGSLFTVVAQHMTGAQVKAWLAEGVANSLNGDFYDSAEQASDAMLMSLARVTQSDPRCLATHLKWYQGPGLAGAAAFTTPFAGCLDSDNDGASRFLDCRDDNAAIAPGKTEVLDGLDNDCDGVVDNLTVKEADAVGGDYSKDPFKGTRVAALPLIIRGQLSQPGVANADDVDSIQLSAPLAGVGTLSLCSDGGQFQVNGLRTNGTAVGPLLRTQGAGCAQRTLTDVEPWAGFYVLRPPNATIGGTYTLSISQSTETSSLAAAATQLTQSNQKRVQSNHTPASLAGGNSGLQVRWFQSGAGFVQSLAAGDANAHIAPVLTIPANAARPVKLRAQLWRDGMPTEEPSRPLTMVQSGSLADCIFSWGERSLPSAFPTTGASAGNLGAFYFRYYPASNTFLASSSADDSLYYLAASSGNGVVSLGDLAIWKTHAGCQ
ncbi:MAG: hypothetical protein CFE43_16795 [Burkholderiales bacterium PBB3]|nr:MAG: hypothetical protein CFE43_16795 [Burkholderiales bacterium PBB3]